MGSPPWLILFYTTTAAEVPRICNWHLDQSVCGADRDMSALAIAPCGAAKAWAFQASPSRARAHQRHLHVVCSAAKHGALDRRAVLSGLGAAVTVAAAPLLAIQPAVAAASGFTERAIPVESLTAFQKVSRQYQPLGAAPDAAVAGAF